MMRITVCELPHETAALDDAWEQLCKHTVQHAPDLVLLPELAMVDPVWECERFDLERWAAIEALGDAWIHRLKELRAGFVVGTRPVSAFGARYNEGFIWSADEGAV